MRKILFVLMAAAMLVSCTSVNRNVPFRVKGEISGNIYIHNIDSAYKPNDTLFIEDYGNSNFIVLERVK